MRALLWKIVGEGAPQYMASTKSKKTSRFAAPGAERLTLAGVLAVSDEYGRIRVMLMNPLPSGTVDRSANLLREKMPVGDGGVPYELHPRGADETLGTFWAVPPAHRKEHWLRVAAELRGQEVTIEATVRPYHFTPKGATASIRGVSLDLALLEARAPGGALV